MHQPMMSRGAEAIALGLTSATRPNSRIATGNTHHTKPTIGSTGNQQRSQHKHQSADESPRTECHHAAQYATAYCDNGKTSRTPLTHLAPLSVEKLHLLIALFARSHIVNETDDCRDKEHNANTHRNPHHGLVTILHQYRTGCNGTAGCKDKEKNGNDNDYLILVIQKIVSIRI